MNKNMTSSEPEKRPGTPQGPARKSVLVLTLVVGVGALALTVVALRHGRQDSKSPPFHSAAEAGQAPESSGPGGAASKTVSTSPSMAQVPSPPVLPVVATPSEAERAERARQLVKSLSEVSLQPGELTPQKVEKWQRNLEELIEQGTPAVPVLREFFERNEDLRFDSGSRTNLLGELGEPTLRIAFLKALFDIPAPENVELQEQVLRTTVDPEEIALLARQLDLQEPGKYRQVIVEAARAALQKVQSGALPGRDPRPLVKVVEEYGAAGPK
jgi:hypothetical protein